MFLKKIHSKGTGFGEISHCGISWISRSLPETKQLCTEAPELFRGRGKLTTSSDVGKPRRMLYFAGNPYQLFDSNYSLTSIIRFDLSDFGLQKLRPVEKKNNNNNNSNKILETPKKKSLQNSKKHTCANNPIR